MIVSFFFSKALHSRTGTSTPGEYSFDCRKKINLSCIFHSTCTSREALVIFFYKLDKHFGGSDLIMANFTRSVITVLNV